MPADHFGCRCRVGPPRDVAVYASVVGNGSVNGRTRSIELTAWKSPSLRGAGKQNWPRRKPCRIPCGMLNRRLTLSCQPRLADKKCASTVRWRCQEAPIAHVSRYRGSRRKASDSSVRKFHLEAEKLVVGKVSVSPVHIYVVWEG